MRLVSWLVYGSIRLLFAVIFRVFFRAAIIGRDRAPRHGGVLVVSNHISWADPPLLAVALPRPADFMAMVELFRSPGIGWLMRALRAFPVDRSRVDHGAAREAIRRLRAGRCVSIFPEAGIRLTEKSVLGGSPEFKPGAGSIALLGGAVILPVIIRNSRAPYDWHNWLRRARISVTFGCPFCLWNPQKLASDERRRRAREILREQLLKTVELN